MKKLFIFLFLICSSCWLFAQKETSKEIPSQVKLKFESLYPEVNNAKWTSEEGNFEAEFKDKNEEISVVFDQQGNLIETEKSIEVTALPKAATDYLATTYPGKKITEAAKIVDAKDIITYEAEVGKTDVIFDAGGKFVKENK